MYFIYTDGACSKNGSKDAIASWGYIVVNEQDQPIHSANGGAPGKTNQWGELSGAIHACKFAQKTLPITDENFTNFIIYTDSAYIINCEKNGWYINWCANGWRNAKKEPVANRELWEELIPFFDNPYFEFRKVKGHNGNKWNEEVDKLAVSWRLSKNLTFSQNGCII